MGDEPRHSVVDGREEPAVHELGFNVASIIAEVDEDHVRVDVGDRHAIDAFEYLGDRSGHHVVLDNTGSVVVEGVDSCGREDTGLTHTAA